METRERKFLTFEREEGGERVERRVTQEEGATYTEDIMMKQTRRCFFGLRKGEEKVSNEKTSSKDARLLYYLLARENAGEDCVICVQLVDEKWNFSEAEEPFRKRPSPPLHPHIHSGAKGRQREMRKEESPSAYGLRGQAK